MIIRCQQLLRHGEKPILTHVSTSWQMLLIYPAAPLTPVLCAASSVLYCWPKAPFSVPVLCVAAHSNSFKEVGLVRMAAIPNTGFIRLLKSLLAGMCCPCSVSNIISHCAFRHNVLANSHTCYLHTPKQNPCSQDKLNLTATISLLTSATKPSKQFLPTAP